MKIWWQQPMPEQMPAVSNVAKMWTGVLAVLKELAAEGTEITQHFLEKGTYAIHTDFLQMYNNKSIVETILQAEKQGYDAVVLGCWGDPGLFAARAVLEIPVIGIAEASYLFACVAGRKAAAITVQPELVPGMENTLKIYGFAERMISRRPIRAFDLKNEEMQELFDEPYKNIIPKFEAVARECIADGADTIIAACGWLGPALTKAGYREIPGTKNPVLVLDPCAVALKLAEGWVDLHKKTGFLKSRSVYFKMTKTVIKILNQNFNAGVEYEG